MIVGDPSRRDFPPFVLLRGDLLQCQTVEIVNDLAAFIRVVPREEFHDSEFGHFCLFAVGGDLPERTGFSTPR